jgi:LPXTG-site transpeptidase (sortase) family protein
MMNRIKTLWAAYGRWVWLALPVVTLTVCLAISAATAGNSPRTIAEPPAEREITFDMEQNRAYTAEDGIVVIPASVTPGSGGAVTHAATIAAPEPAAVKTGGNYTLPEEVQMPDGSIGLLSIPKLSLSVSAYETADEMEAMSHGVAHFKTTSSWLGNIGLCGHNQNFDLTDGYFKQLHTLVPGDTISYQTALGTKTYTVETVAEIIETDWSYLGRTEDDRVTLITCISGKPRSRLVVQAVATA